MVYCIDGYKISEVYVLVRENTINNKNQHIIYLLMSGKKFQSIFTQIT